MARLRAKMTQQMLRKEAQKKPGRGPKCLMPATSWETQQQQNGKDTSNQKIATRSQHVYQNGRQDPDCMAGHDFRGHTETKRCKKVRFPETKRDAFNRSQQLGKASQAPTSQDAISMCGRGGGGEKPYRSPPWGQNI